MGNNQRNLRTKSPGRLANKGDSHGEVEAYLITYMEVTNGGTKKCVLQASLEPTVPIVFLDEGIRERTLIKAVPLYTKLYITKTGGE